MATTETRTPNQLTVSGVDADWTADNYMHLHSITFKPGAANDVLSLKEGTDAGPEIFPSLPTDAEPRTFYCGGMRSKPMIDLSACTLTAGAKVIFTLDVKRGG